MNDKTIINVPTGTELTLENHNGDEEIVIRVFNAATGDHGTRRVRAGSRVSDVIGESEAGEVRVNRRPAAADDELEDGDRVSLTPSNVEGGV